MWRAPDSSPLPPVFRAGDRVTFRGFRDADFSVEVVEDAVAFDDQGFVVDRKLGLMARPFDADRRFRPA